MAKSYLGVPPWMDDDSRPAGFPEISVEMGDDEVVYGLVIRRPFGAGTDTILTITAHRVTLAVTAAEAAPTAVLDARRAN